MNKFLQERDIFNDSCNSESKGDKIENNIDNDENDESNKSTSEDKLDIPPKNNTSNTSDDQFEPFDENDGSNNIAKEVAADPVNDNGVNESRTSANENELPISANENEPTASANGNEIPESANENEMEYMETPRRIRKLPARSYCLKEKAPLTEEQLIELEFDNSITPQIREIDPERKNLYDTDGDEIYIGNGRMIQIAFWEYMKHRGCTTFLRELLSIYYKENVLVNKCFQVSRVSTELENRSPRKPFTPSTYSTIRTVYKDYLNTHYKDPVKKQYYLKNMNRVIGHKIRDLRSLRYVKKSN